MKIKSQQYLENLVLHFKAKILIQKLKASLYLWIIYKLQFKTKKNLSTRKLIQMTNKKM